MGDFLSEIVVFLEEYYVYVIGVGLIIVLMLIGFLASKRKAKKASKEDETMANINDVDTGSIDEVADTLQNDIMQPVDVIDFVVDNSPIIKEEPVNVNFAEEQQMEIPSNENPEVIPTTPINTEPITTPINNSFNNSEPVVEDFLIDDTDIIKPIVAEENVVEAITPIEEDKFDKTEVIDFQTLEPEKPVEPDLNNINPFVVDRSQYADSGDILNGESGSDELPRL
jgi:type II secretory pathway pseudopilin PulG